MFISSDIMNILNYELNNLNNINEKKTSDLTEKTYLESVLNGIIMACETIKKDNDID